MEISSGTRCLDTLFIQAVKAQADPYFASHTYHAYATKGQNQITETGKVCANKKARDQTAVLFSTSLF